MRRACREASARSSARTQRGDARGEEEEAEEGDAGFGQPEAERVLGLGDVDVDAASADIDEVGGDAIGEVAEVERRGRARNCLTR